MSPNSIDVTEWQTRGNCGFRNFASINCLNWHKRKRLSPTHCVVHLYWQGFVQPVISLDRGKQIYCDYSIVRWSFLWWLKSVEFSNLGSGGIYLQNNNAGRYTVWYTSDCKLEWSHFRANNIGVVNWLRREEPSWAKVAWINFDCEVVSCKRLVR